MKFRYDKKDNIIRRKVKVSTIETDKGKKLDYKFEFDFITGPDGKKKAIVSVNDKIVVLDQGQSCIFILESERIDSTRLKIRPDFEKDGCRTVVCFDPKVRDEDI